MQINANYSVNGVPYDNKRKQNNILNLVRNVRFRKMKI